VVDPALSHGGQFKLIKLKLTPYDPMLWSNMDIHSFIARIDNRWRARRVLKALWLSYPEHSEGRRYYEAIFDATFFIA
jgi:hypothetical protein